jgi:hypothetical protein
MNPIESFFTVWGREAQKTAHHITDLGAECTGHSPLTPLDSLSGPVPAIPQKEKQ